MSDRSDTTIEEGAYFKFPSGHVIVVHELWRGQWLYEVRPDGVETQEPLVRLARMNKEEFEQEVASAGGKRVR